MSFDDDYWYYASTLGGSKVIPKTLQTLVAAYLTTTSIEVCRKKEETDNKLLQKRMPTEASSSSRSEKPDKDKEIQIPHTPSQQCIELCWACTS